MGILDWLKGRKKKVQQTGDESLGRREGNQAPPIATVSHGYKPKTTSEARHQYLGTVEERDAWIRKTFKFVDYMIEGVRVVNIDIKDDGYVYEVYNSNSRTTALRFLRAIPQSEILPLYYIIVETSTGNIGKDSGGMFDESTGDPID